MVRNERFCVLLLVGLFSPIGCGVLAAQQNAEPQRTWPAASALESRPGQRQMVVFVDPHTLRAYTTLHKATRLRESTGVAGVVCLVGPEGATDAWFEAMLGGSLKASGLTVVYDRGGAEAARFGVQTSGVCLVYDAAGKLCFWGDLAPDVGEPEDTRIEAARRALSRTPAMQKQPVRYPATGPIFKPGSRGP